MADTDHRTSTPFLLRIFSRNGRFNDIHDFEDGRLPQSEINIHIWPNTTLGEVVDLVANDLQASPDEDDGQLQIKCRLVYGDYRRNRYDTRFVGVVQYGTKGLDYNKTMDELRFVVGDWLDLALVRPGDQLYNRNDRKPSYNGVPRQGSGSNHRMLGNNDRPRDDFRRPYNRPARGPRDRPRRRDNGHSAADHW